MQKSGLVQYQVWIGFLVALTIAVSSFRPASAVVSQLSEPPSDQVVVKLKPNVAIANILTRYNVTLVGNIKETNLYFLKLSNGQTASQILPTMNADTDLYYAEPNYYADSAPDGKVILFRAHWAPQGEVILFRAHGDTTPVAGTDQWAWNKIGLSDARKLSNGQGIVVAVLDTGLAADHPMLNASITAGYDFVGMSNAIYDTGNNVDDDGDGYVDEELGHGTHVSGIILTAAPGVQIMPIRVLNSDGVGTYWEIAAGIRYAVDHGAKIINMSMSAPRLTPSLADALAYAASRNVLVVSATGTGAGPNYPAAYTNVIGVGASDQNDAVASFSGGQLGDTDLYAPGVDVYSAYPYSNYVLGSGTSMAAPMVAGEAALLMSRYPTWTAAQVVQRILGSTVPMAGGVQPGRVNLGNALNTGFSVQYGSADGATLTDNSIKPHVFIVNNTTQDVALNQFKLRYWNTADTTGTQIFNCDSSSIGCNNVFGSFINLASGDPNRTASSDSYMEMSFSSQAGNLAAGAKAEFYLRFAKSDWSNYNEANDYSYDSAVAPRTWSKITLMRNGELVWGVEPSAAILTAIYTPTTVVASSTPTNVAPTAAATATKTATSTNVSPTATKTATATNVPPTAAATATKTATATNVSPTATKTATASGALKLRYVQTNATVSTQAVYPQFMLVNTGTTSVTFSSIKVRYWYNMEGTSSQSFVCDYVAIGCSNFFGRFVASTRPNANYYVEYTFASSLGSLAPGASTEVFQSRFNKDDWSNYDQSNDYSFDGSKNQLVDFTKMTVYINDVLVWGVEP